MSEDNNLPELTDREMKFVMGILSGKTASDAYRDATDTSNLSNAALWVEASRMKSRPKVSLWLAMARQAAMDNAIVTQQEHLAQLARIREKAYEDRAYGPAVTAEVKRGEACGLYTTQVRDVTERSPEETLRAIHQVSPEIAAALAAQHGIPWVGEPESKAVN